VSRIAGFADRKGQPLGNKFVRVAAPRWERPPEPIVSAPWIFKRRTEIMPRGDKDAYTDKQKRKAEHIEEGYEKRGVPEDEAERRAWATVNKESGGGNKSGSGRGKPDTHESAKKGGRIGGAASASRTKAERSASAKKAAATRKRNAS
jgi:plasmid stabilization system protein ParE